MRANAFFMIGLALPLACGPAGDDIESAQQLSIGSGADPNPSISFTQVGRTVGINRTNEPASAGTFDATGTLAYGGVAGRSRRRRPARLLCGATTARHPHLSGLFINNGARRLRQEPVHRVVPAIDSELSEPRPVQRDAVRRRPDRRWPGRLLLHRLERLRRACASIRASPARRLDRPELRVLRHHRWPGVRRRQRRRQDRRAEPRCQPSFDVYTAYYSQTAPYLWRLNNGTPNIKTWPTTHELPRTCG